MSTSCFDREDESFIVLVNREDQYSIWPGWKAVPGGWVAVEGVAGDKKTVLAYVETHWTDMRPKSLREWMAAQQGGSTVDAVANAAAVAGTAVAHIAVTAAD